MKTVLLTNATCIYLCYWQGCGSNVLHVTTMLLSFWYVMLLCAQASWWDGQSSFAVALYVKADILSTEIL